ncbi:MAG: NusA N-terminal domain-containing protein [Pirellulales bacterium]
MAMNPGDMLRIVDSLHREKNIQKEIVFQAIEAALGNGSQEALRRKCGHSYSH